VQAMLLGAMDELRLGDPWDFATDVGPVIDERAWTKITDHVGRAESEGRVLKRLPASAGGWFVGPAVLRVNGVQDLEEEIFGPVLHLATFEADELGEVVRAVNASGYGLTFGLHTRIDDRVQAIVDGLKVGNIYVNRNQIGAIVGSQPFGGEGLSGTGPKAGGPHYVSRFKRAEPGESEGEAGDCRPIGGEEVEKALARLPSPPGDELRSIELPGPTGESNRLFLHPRGPILCLGPGAEAAMAQALAARRAGCPALAVAPGVEDGLDGALDLAALSTIKGIAGVALFADDETARRARKALAARQGPILPLIVDVEVEAQCRLERHLCIDTTAAGGNASLLSKAAG
jgi:RHH-type proline utilization regulon transcriptional repressor/proline dehydrogenase/delta 1-pyrroline-5-carboxylate dehydrogenase